jgi:hypothetical protein
MVAEKIGKLLREGFIMQMYFPEHLPNRLLSTSQT